MELGDINKGAVVLILVLLMGAGGYLWYKQMYTPAVTERTAAQGEVATAESALTAAKAKLASAQEQYEAAKSESKKTDDSVARVAKARSAVPDKKLVDDAAIVLMDIADRAGISTSFKSEEEGAAGFQGDASSLQGAQPIDLTFKAAGTYSEMMQFMTLVEDTVSRKGDTLYSRGRLFNVVQLTIGEEDEGSSSGTDGFGGELLSAGGGEDGLVVGKNDIVFKVVVRMYTSAVDNSQNVGGAIPMDDPAAAGTDPNAVPGAADGTAAADAGAGATVDGAGAPADGSAATTPQPDPAAAAA